MKKALTLLLSLTLCVGLLAGCGSKKEEAPAASSAPAASTPAASTATGKGYYLNFKPEVPVRQPAGPHRLG